MLDWPIVTDVELADELVERVRSRPGRVQLILGEVGIGKTTLASAVSRGLEAAGFGILPIVALAELSSIPLAAMTPLLARSGQDVALGASERLQALFAYVAAAGGKRVLMIDDGPWLDDVSAAAVYQLLRVYNLRCLMTARTGVPITGPLARLLDEGSVDSVELSGMTDNVAQELVRRALGGPIDQASLRAVTRLAHGNPLFLREILLAAADRGAVREGSAGFVIESAGLPPRLRDSIAARFAGLTEAQRTVAELISVAEPWPLALLDETDSLRALETASITRATASGELYLAHPAYGETLRELMTPTARDARRAEAARRLLGTGGEDERFRAICLLAETSTKPAPDDLNWAAFHAHTLDDHGLALRLAELSIAQGVSFDGLFIRALALSAASDLDEADVAFETAAGAADTDDRRVRVASGQGYHLAFRRQRPAEAVALAAAVAASVPDSPGRQFLRADIGKWRLMAGDADAATSADPSAEPDVQLAAASEMNGIVLRLGAAVFSSNLDAAAAAIVRGRELESSTRREVPHGANLLDFGEFTSRALRGPIGAALDDVDPLRFAATNDNAGMWNWGVGLFTFHAGRAEETLVRASAAVEQLAWRDYAGALGAAMALRATAAAILGQRQFADAILASLNPDFRSQLVVQLQAAQAEGWILARAGELDAAAEHVAAAVTRGNAAKQFGLSALAAHAAVRMGRPAVVIESLREIGANAQGGVIAAIVQHGEALLGRDARAVLDAATALETMGVLGGAVDAAQQAASLARASGDSELARKATLLATRLDVGLSGFHPNVQARTSEELTEREWAVATAAAGRARSKEIAERLGVSARTVDNHLTNIYRKLGVSSRDELRVELERMERP